MEEKNFNFKNHLDRLAFNAPLVSSTRRSWSSYGDINGVDQGRLPSSDATRQTVPFSWEISPGVPKDQIPKDVYVDSMHFPPKPPPGRWRRQSNYSREGVRANENGRRDCGGSDGDDDRGSTGGSNDDVFSDALDEITLCDELDFASRLSSFEGVATPNDGDRRRRAVCRAPSFIMKRFLPAANALAKASAAHSTNPNLKHSNVTPTSSSHRVQQKQQRSKPSSSRRGSAKLQDSILPHVQDQNQRDKMPSTACGLMLFLPWTLKPIACGFKSPVRSQTPRTSYLNALSRRAIDESCDDHGWSFEDDDNYGRGGFPAADHKMSSKPRHSPGRGLSFLDTTRLRINKGRDQVERWKAKARMEEGGRERADQKRRDDDINGVMEYCSARNGRDIWNIPHLTSPSESWLSHVLHSTRRD